MAKFICLVYDLYVSYICQNSILTVVFTTDMKQITFGKRLLEVRKNKKISQDELAKKTNVHGAVIGRYERDEVKPSIEMAALIANALEVSLDYLVGNTDLLLDSSVLQRIMDIQKLNDQDKTDALKLLDMFLRDTKARKAYA
jgi:transcriptional regulator with XRE-family HTH domain